MLHKIAYISEAVREFSRLELEVMLLDFRDKNQRLGITGLLRYRAKTFMQFLEGDEDKVMALFRQIQVDERHTNLYLVWQKPIETRVWPKWSMQFEWLDGKEKFSMSDLALQNIQQMLRDIRGDDR